MNQQHGRFDVIIVGGSYAGLSAALALGRTLRKVLIIDAGKPCNIQTPHSHNFLTQDGKPPAKIAHEARNQLQNYKTIEIINDVAVDASKANEGFKIHLQAGRTVLSKKLIFASGIKDKLPDIPGFSDCWGISVIHCPYCHGYEYKGRKTGIFANGEAAIHYATLLINITQDLTILTNGKADFSDEQRNKLQAHNIRVIESELVGIEHQEGMLKQIVFKDGINTELDALYFRPPFEQHTNIPQSLGCELNEQGYLKIDASQKTTVEGVYACGDNSSMMRSVANAVSSGNFTGATVNRELALEQFSNINASELTNTYHAMTPQ